MKWTGLVSMSILPPSAYGLNLYRSDPTMSSSHGSLVLTLCVWGRTRLVVQCTICSFDLFTVRSCCHNSPGRTHGPRLSELSSCLPHSSQLSLQNSPTVIKCQFQTNVVHNVQELKLKCQIQVTNTSNIVTKLQWGCWSVKQEPT